MSKDSLSEFLPPYLVEVEELLGTARKLLLAAESSARQGSANPRAVRDLFRGVHTIKGLSAMVDVEPIVTIAHLMETCLRRADRDGGKLPTDAVEPMMRGLAAIEQRVRVLSQRGVVPPPPGALLDALESLAAAPARALPSTPAEMELALDPALLGKLSSSEREQLAQGVRAGQRAVRVDFAPSPVRAQAGLNINTVRERLARLGEIVKVFPVSTAPSETHPGGLFFAVLLLTTQTDATVGEAVGVPASEVVELAAPEGEVGVSTEIDVFDDVDLTDDASAGTAGQTQGVVRVQARRLDDAMDGIAALVVNRSRLTRAVASLTASGANTRELAQILTENGRMLRDLRNAIVRIRMVRVSEVLDRLPLMVRGLRRTTGKLVALEMDVGQAELDKAVGDRLFPAVVHLVRNAVDHAIEPPDVRARAGKPSESVLRISCHERSNAQLELVVQDDGRGIDAAEVARRAGGPTPQTEADLLDLLCRPGLSTRDEVTTTSGRGMGMDIVKRIAVDQLGGQLKLETGKGQGTTFTLRVPLTVSILDAFIFEAGAQRFAAAVSTVDELFEVDPSQVSQGPAPRDRTGRGAAVALMNRRGTAVPLVNLASMLELASPGGGHKAIQIQLRGQPMAFAVDRMVAQQEIVVRPLEDPLVRVRGVAGATDLGDGLPTLVLDLFALGAREVLQ